MRHFILGSLVTAVILIGSISYINKGSACVISKADTDKLVDSSIDYSQYNW